MLDLHLSKIADEKGRLAGYWNVYFLGISLVFASLLISWPFGLYAGFWPYFLSTLIIGVAYICLMCCLAEMSSILPFSGGAYGFVRVTTYPYFGFMIGCIESFANIMYVAIAIVAIGEAITFTFRSDPTVEPIYWLVIYLLSLALLIFGDQSFFFWTTTLGIISMVLVVLYLVASSDTMDFDRFVTKEEVNQSVWVDMKTFVALLPVSSWMFVGVDTLPLACSDTKQAKKTVPLAMTHCMYTSFLFSMVILVAVSSQTPGIIALFNYESLPLNMGYAKAFHMSDRLATLLSLPGLFISNYAFMYAYGKQLYALSRSKLMPESFQNTYGNIKMPHIALITGAVIGYIFVLCCWYLCDDLLFAMNMIYNACQMGSFTIYCASFSAFIIFRVKYHTLERKYMNRLGIMSALIGIIVFVMAFYGVAILQEDDYTAAISFGVFVCMASIAYFAYARYHQCYSPEESSIMFIIYVIKANIARKKAFHARFMTLMKQIGCCCFGPKMDKIERALSSMSSPSVKTKKAASKYKISVVQPTKATTKKPQINVSRDDNTVIAFDSPNQHHRDSVPTALITYTELEVTKEDEKDMEETINEAIFEKPKAKSTSTSKRELISVKRIVPDPSPVPLDDDEVEKINLESPILK